jgi:hypothetical protein
MIFEIDALKVILTLHSPVHSKRDLQEISY